MHMSAGVRAMHKLPSELADRGCTVTAVSYDDSPDPLSGTHILPEAYPIPFEPDRTVRWLLSSVRPFPCEHEVTWNPEFFPNTDFLRVDVIEPDLFYPDDRERGHYITYGGKAGQVSLVGSMERYEIVRNPPYPADRKALAEMLRSAKYLLCYDTLSMIAIESILCGTPVVLFGKQYINVDKIPGMCYGMDDLNEASASVRFAQEWYDKEKLRFADSVDKFVDKYG